MTINVLRILTVFFGLYIVMRWNDLMANWIETSTLYIPHITKLYLGLLISIYLIFRGFIMPFFKGVQVQDLAPIRWIYFGVIGIVIDLVKAPGYIVGGIFSFIRRLFSKKLKAN